jgi:hypothetical protein
MDKLSLDQETRTVGIISGIKLSLYQILVVIVLFVVIFMQMFCLFFWPLGDAALRMNYENVRASRFSFKF